MSTAATLIWSDASTHQSCFMRTHANGAELELRFYGWRVQSFVFDTVEQAESRARQWLESLALAVAG